MFNGLYTSGDPFLDKVLYGATAIIIVTAIVTFGAPLFSLILSKFF